MKKLTASTYIENIQVFQRLLDQLPRTVSTKIIKRAMRVASNDMMKATRRAAPRKSGLLKKSLNIRQLKPMRGRFGFFVGFKNVDEILARSATKDGTRYFYPTSVEYGHKGPYPAEAHPFMRPAFEANRAAATETIARELRAGIEKAAEEGSK